MSDRAYAKIRAQQKTLRGSPPKSSLLQRTCACGQHIIAGAQCSTCRSEQSTGHRAQRAFESASAPVSRSGSAPAQEHVPSFNAAFDRTSRFGHDFSQIPIHAPATGAVQAKLTVNAPGDIYEQEADRVSERVMRTATPLAPNVQRQTEAEKLIQSKITGEAQVQTAPTTVHEVLRSSSQPLDRATRAFMEPRFGHDFSRVRVHLDSQAAASARGVDALAYTVGRDIVFAQGQFAPHTASGQRLLAHELAHTLQQGVAAEQVTVGDLRVGQQNDPFEQEAERVSASALSARVEVPSEKPTIASLRPDARPALRRQPKTRPEISPPRIPYKGDIPPKNEGGQEAPTPAQPGVTTPTPAESECKPPSNVALPCSPQGVSNDVFLKKGAPQEAFGHTTYRPQTIPNPEVLTKPIGKQVVLQPTKGTQISCESFFTTAGPPFWRIVPFSIDAKDPEQREKQREAADKCRGGLYSRKFRITNDGEKKIREMELEHCTDYKHAFDISIGCYVNVVNELANGKMRFPSHEDAVDAVTKRVGLKPDAWAQHYQNLLDKSAERDTKKWHDAISQGPRPIVEVDEKTGRCKAQDWSEAEINGKSYPEVGKHPTPDVIR